MLRSLLALGLMFCVASNAAAQDPPRVVVVNYALQYFTERLLDDTADVVFPVSADVDPSFWRPSIADISMIQSADLILLNGAGFATWVDRVSLPRSKVVNTTAGIEDQFIVTESITHSHGDGGEHSHEGLASYTWLDPALAIAQAEAIASAIIARELAQAGDVDANLAELRAELEALDEQTRIALDGLGDVAIIATHPRYQYFARRYGLSINTLEWEAGAMPNDAEIADLRALTTETQAQILIWEATPPVAAFELTQELGLQNVVFTPLAHGVNGHSFLDHIENAVSALVGAK